MNKPYVIDLTSSTPSSIQALVGEENGQDAFKSVDLKQLETNHSEILIRIPPHVNLITQSFVRGMFFDALKRLGKDRFFEKYKFIASQAIAEKVKTHIEALEIKIKLGDNS